MVLPSPQNIHLVAKWLRTLQKKLEEHSEKSHPEFRVFISAEPAPSTEGHVIPQGILENSVKITNEPPTGMHANLHKALDNFTQVGGPGREGRRVPHLTKSRFPGWESSTQLGWGGGPTGAVPSVGEMCPLCK